MKQAASIRWKPQTSIRDIRLEIKGDSAPALSLYKVGVGALI